MQLFRKTRRVCGHPNSMKLGGFYLDVILSGTDMGWFIWFSLVLQRRGGFIWMWFWMGAILFGMIYMVKLNSAKNFPGSVSRQKMTRVDVFFWREIPTPKISWTFGVVNYAIYSGGYSKSCFGSKTWFFSSFKFLGHPLVKYQGVVPHMFIIIYHLYPLT